MSELEGSNLLGHDILLFWKYSLSSTAPHLWS